MICSLDSALKDHAKMMQHVHHVVKVIMSVIVSKDIKVNKLYKDI